MKPSGGEAADKQTLLSAIVPLMALQLVSATIPATPAGASGEGAGSKVVIIPIGTLIEGRIDKQIGSSISRHGDRFTITIDSPVIANGTDILIPSGAQILGEVVEAIHAGAFHHEKDELKPHGRLEVTLNGLRTPDGVAYPLVGRLEGEAIVMPGGGSGDKKTGIKLRENLQAATGSVAYIGTNQGFESVQPHAYSGGGGRRGSPPPSNGVLTKSDMLRDPIYGLTGAQDPLTGRRLAIRSLVKRHNELYIDQGAPLTVRLLAPLKLGQVAPPSLLPPPSLATGQTPPPDTGGRRFTPIAPTQEDAQKKKDEAAKKQSAEAEAQAQAQPQQAPSDPNNPYDIPGTVFGGVPALKNKAPANLPIPPANMGRGQPSNGTLPPDRSF